MSKSTYIVFKVDSLVNFRGFPCSLFVESSDAEQMRFAFLEVGNNWEKFFCPYGFLPIGFASKARFKNVACKIW